MFGLLCWSNPHLHAYWHGTIVPRPSRLLRVSVRLSEQRPPAALPAVHEVAVPLRALAHVRSYASPAIVTVLFSWFNRVSGGGGGDGGGTRAQRYTPGQRDWMQSWYF